jgi:hypothetical protein
MAGLESYQRTKHETKGDGIPASRLLYQIAEHKILHGDRVRSSPSLGDQPRQHTERLKSKKRLWEKRAKSISGKSNCKDFFLISNVIFYRSAVNFRGQSRTRDPLESSRPFKAAAA